MNFNNLFMAHALQQAELAYKQREVPIGAVIVNSSTKQIISTAHNLVEQRKNPILHAEMIAITAACTALSSKNLSAHDIYVTVEPCVMCAAAIANARIDRVFYGALDSKHGGIESNIRFFNSKACFHHPEIYGNLSAKPSAMLMKKFFKEIRGG